MLMSENVLIFVASVLSGLVVDLYRRVRSLEVNMKDSLTRQELEQQVKLHIKPLEVLLKEVKEDIKDNQQTNKVILEHILSSGRSSNNSTNK